MRDADQEKPGRFGDARLEFADRGVLRDAGLSLVSADEEAAAARGDAFLLYQDDEIDRCDGVMHVFLDEEPELPKGRLAAQVQKALLRIPQWAVGSWSRVVRRGVSAGELIQRGAG